MPTWKRMFIKAVGVGIGVVIGVAIVWGTVNWWKHRPQPWRHDVIAGTYTSLAMQVRGDDIHFNFTYAFHNNGNSDYYVPDGVAGELLKKWPEGGGLQRIPNISWPERIIIPAKQAVNVEFDVPFKLEAFNTNAKELEPTDKLVKFAGRRLSEIDGFTFFDYTNRYQVELPKGWQEAVKNSERPQVNMQ